MEFSFLILSISDLLVDRVPKVKTQGSVGTKNESKRFVIIRCTYHYNFLETHGSEKMD